MLIENRPFTASVTVRPPIDTWLAFLIIATESSSESFLLTVNQRVAPVRSHGVSVLRFRTFPVIVLSSPRMISNMRVHDQKTDWQIVQREHHRRYRDQCRAGR